jgi:hypothetical protein
MINVLSVFVESACDTKVKFLGGVVDVSTGIVGNFCGDDGNDDAGACFAIQ